VIYKSKRKGTKLIGCLPAHFDLLSIDILEGQVFNGYHIEHGLPVCVIGQTVKERLFGNKDAIGEYIKCANVWFKIIGITKNKSISSDMDQSFSINHSGNQVYIPVKTMLLRVKNRGLITDQLIKANEEDDEEEESNKKSINFNQLDKIIVQVNETEQIIPTTNIVRRMLKRRHFGEQDFEIVVPELLLKQQQRTKDIFNLVLGAIAGISLLVGGIGIMNIMLASVMERIKEIGVRRALGATRKDIIVQFLAESTLISVTGGLIGIGGGIALSKLVTRFADITTILSWSSIIVSFSISVTVGIVFGYMPARKAADQDPVVSLRTE